MFLLRQQRAALTTLTAVLAVQLAAADPALAQKKVKPGPVPAYGLTDLGAGHAEGITFPNADSVVLVAGSAYTPQATPSGPQAWLWAADAVTGTILGGSSLAATSSDACSINDSGLVVGTSSLGEFVYVPGVGLVPLNEAAHPVRTINNAGDIVGRTLTEGALWHMDAVGNVTGPVLLGGFSPQDINDWGLMAGYQFEQVSENEWIAHAAIAWFDAGVLQVLELPDLVAGLGGFASAVNNRGEVVGRCWDGTQDRATLWNTPTSAPIDLGSLPGSGDYPSLATAINDNGQVVGASQGRAFLWQNGTLSDLNDLAGINGKGEKILQSAQGINNAGHIVGKMWIRNSGQHGFLLTRIP